MSTCMALSLLERKGLGGGAPPRTATKMPASRASARPGAGNRFRLTAAGAVTILRPTHTRGWCAAVKHWQETSLLFEEAARVAGSGGRAALATVVRILGSTYRRPGAKLLVTDDGEPRLSATQPVRVTVWPPPTLGVQGSGDQMQLSWPRRMPVPG